MRVFIAGMHRSGTSAVAQALMESGVEFGPIDQLMGPSLGNSRGHFESVPHNEISESLLKLCGHSFASPPRRGLEPSDFSHFPRLLSDAKRIDYSFLGTKPGVIKNPRFAVLMPFWDQVTGMATPVIMPWRHPMGVADSLFRRNGLPRTLGLALWFRYNRTLLLDSTNRAIFIFEVTAKGANLTGLEEFLLSCGIRSSRPIADSWFEEELFGVAPPVYEEYEEDIVKMVSLIRQSCGANPTGVKIEYFPEPRWVDEAISTYQLSEPDRVAAADLAKQMALLTNENLDLKTQLRRESELLNATTGLLKQLSKYSESAERQALEMDTLVRSINKDSSAQQATLLDRAESAEKLLEAMTSSQFWKLTLGPQKVVRTLRKLVE